MKGYKVIVLLLVLVLLPMGVTFGQSSLQSSLPTTSSIEAKARAAYLERAKDINSFQPKQIRQGLPEEGVTSPPIETEKGNFVANSEGKISVIVDLPSRPLTQELKEKGILWQSPETQTLRSALENEHKGALAKLDGAGISYQVLATYAVAYNGIAIQIDRASLSRVQEIFGPESVHPSKTYYLDMEYSTALTGATDVWANLDYEGEGMVVGVVDTGVDYNHPDLGGGFGNKVIAMTDVADQDEDAMDENGHGTHVSGIMAAKAAEPSGVTGMAPLAKLIVAKIVKGGEGSATSIDIAQAFDWMLQKKLEGLNLASINMSFGFPGGWNNPTDPEQVAIQNCVDSGIFVSLSAGNEYWSVYPYNQVNWYGEDPSRVTWYPADISTLGSPSSTPGPASVAASWNTNSRYVSFLVTDGSGFRGPYTSSAVDPVTFYKGVPQSFVYVGYGNDDSYYEGKDVTGKIALVVRGGPGVADFTNKQTIALNHGAVGVLVMNDQARGDALVTMVTPEGFPIPALFTGYSYGTYLVNHPDAQILFDGQTASFPNPTPDKMVDFSSWGTDPNLNFKPEIAAPGGGIWSTVPLSMGGYDNYSGTSMASPHVGGAAALIKQAHPDWTPLQVKAALMNTATLLTDPNTNLPYSPRLQGAGRINVYDALLTPVFVADNATDYPAEPLGDTDSTTSKTFTLKATNTGDVDITYDLSATIQSYSGSRVPYSLVGGTVTFPGGNSITVPAGGSATFDVVVDVSGNTSYENIFVDGFVTLTPTTSTPDAAMSILQNNVASLPELHVPYTLFWGDWQDTRYTYDWIHNPVIEPPMDDPSDWTLYWGFTWPFWQEGEYLYYLGFDFWGDPVRDTIAISPNGDGVQDNLHPLISLMRGTKNLNISLYGDTGNLVKTIAQERYVPKNFDRYPYWDSWDYSWLWEPAAGELPDGNYTLRYQAAIPATLNGPTTGYDVQELPLIVDTVNPTVEIISVTPTNGGTEVTWSGLDDRSGIWGYGVFADGDPYDLVDPTTNSYVISGTPSVIEVVAWDNAGNQGWATNGYTLSLKAGWNLVSIPLVTDPDPDVVFADLPTPWSLYTWDPLNHFYLTKSQSTIEAGKGFWLRVSTDVDYTVVGQPSSESTVHLFPGWNIIGMPYIGDANWSDLMVTKGSETKTMAEAVEAGWLKNVAWGWNGSNYENVVTDPGYLQSGLGYWVMANYELELIFPLLGNDKLRT